MGKLYDLLSSLIEKVNSTVKVSAQTLTDEQKTQARANIGAGTSDVKTWSNIEDKPFGDFPTGGDTLTWDGNTEGLASMYLGNTRLNLVSDVTPTIDDLANGLRIILYFNTPAITREQTIDFTLADVMEDRGVIYVGMIYIVSEEAAGVDLGGFIFPRKGLYFWGDHDAEGYCAHVTSLTIHGYTGFPVTKKIEEKYLP